MKYGFLTFRFSDFMTTLTLVLLDILSLFLMCITLTERKFKWLNVNFLLDFQPLASKSLYVMLRIKSKIKLMDQLVLQNKL